MMFRKTNKNGIMCASGSIHLRNEKDGNSTPIPAPKEEVVEQHNVFKAPVVKRKKLKFQRD